MFHIWLVTKSEGGTFRDIANSIDCEQSGSFVVGGWTASSTLTIGTTVLTNEGSNDIWLAKYDSSGNVLWAKSAGISGLEDCGGIAISPKGDIYIAGWYDSSAIHLDNIILINYGGTDIFTAKLDVITGMETYDDFNTEIFISPNPTSGILNVSASVAIENIIAFNSLGQLIYELSPRARQTSIRLDEPGIYNIRISTAEGFVTKRVVVTN
jgi:hypothetical protein